MQKQWFNFMLWGRLSYDPTLSDEFFQRTLSARFPSDSLAVTEWYQYNKAKLFSRVS